MMQPHLFHLLKDGTSQQDRLLPALKAGYFQVDELSFADLMAMAWRYAQLVSYVDADNKVAGSWQGFFESDEAFVLSTMLATNLDLLEQQFNQYLVGSSSSHPVLSVIQNLDHWLACLAQLHSVAAARIRERICDVIEHSLQAKIIELYQFLGQTIPPLQQITLNSVAEGNTWLEQGAPEVFLRSNFNAFYNALLLLQSSAEDILQLALQRADHDPAVATYIAFLRLYSKLQTQIGDFSQRHLRFYYHDVLKVKARPMVAGSVYIQLTVDKPGREVLLPAGSEFKAQLDPNQAEQLYAADHDILISDATVSDVHTVFFARNPLSFPENQLKDQAGRSFATSARINVMAQNGQFMAQTSPLFGDSREALYPPIRIGLAVASKTLLLKQGQREVELVLTFGDDSLERFIHQLSEQLATTVADAFFKAFRQLFQISLTSEQGWLLVTEYLPICNCVEPSYALGTLALKFTLPDSAPAIVAYNATLHGEDYDTTLPVLKLVLSAENYLYAYSFLSEAPLSKVQLNVAVKGCSDLVLHNQLGQLSASAQFNPFGPMPEVGDYFIVGCYEAACKKLTDFSLRLSWGGLPQQGLARHYQAYGVNYQPEVFKVNVTVLKDRKWLPHDMTLNSELFSDDQQISLQSLCGFAKAISHVSADQFKYDHSVKNGFFRLQLSQPAYAFGHKDYPQVLARIMRENASVRRFRISKFFGKKLPQKALPNPAYTPLINAITVDYRASANIELSMASSRAEVSADDCVFHLHPLGQEKLSPRASRRMACLPHLAEDGNLYLGIRASQLKGVLTLFFHLRDDSKPSYSEQPLLFSWHYLADNQWQDLTSARVLSDSTDGFLRSGTVMLDIPDEINLNNTILPGHCYWLKLAASHPELSRLCSLYAIYTHALKLSWLPQAGSLPEVNQLPAGSIREAKRSIVGLGEIRQVAAGWGYQPPESEQQQVIRVSERLKHKNRAIQAADYERLVLQQFPQIQKVKCFPCMDGRSQSVRPGHLLLVLLPYPKQAETHSQPMVNRLLLNEVKQYVSGLASANVTVHVRNPVYEQIQVRCKIKLRHANRSGYYFNQLNQEIHRYLSPWQGMEARFGWSLRCEDVEAYLQRLSYVESVSGLSLLKITVSDDEVYALTDTARSGQQTLSFSYPWSIAVPAEQHLIDFSEVNRDWQAENTGIAKLAIGSTFILSKE